MVQSLDSIAMSSQTVEEPSGSSLRAECESLASEFVAFVDDLEKALIQLRELAITLPLGNPVATISGWQQTGKFLDEEQQRQSRILEGLRRQIALDLSFAEGLVGRLRSAEDELRRASFVIRPPFEEAASRLFRAEPINGLNGHDELLSKQVTSKSQANGHTS